jgi:hypothetical protein
MQGGLLHSDRSLVLTWCVGPQFPFEPGERVWVLKTGYRAPLGPFTIHRVLPDNMFELKEEATGTVQPEAVDGAFLKREPF